MAEMIDAFTSFFDTQDWDYDVDPERRFVRLGFTGDNGQLSCFAQPRQEEQQLVFYTLCPVTVPEARRHAMAEFLTRVNYGMILGNFEMDYRDGEVRFKASMDLEGTAPTNDLVKPIVFVALGMMDLYLPGILQVVAGVEPVEALASAEGSAEA